jgi:hypothetical protein
MLRLFRSGSAQDIDLVQEAMSDDEWARLRRNVCRHLEEKGEFASAEMLRRNRFELWAATNTFNDDFEILYLRTSSQQYIEMEREVDELANPLKYREIAGAMRTLNHPVRFIAADVDTQEVDVVSTPDLKITSTVVEHALDDVESLLKNRSAVSGLDRVHTAFHGYLKAICADANIATSNDPSITELFKLLRKQHSGLQVKAGAESIDHILKAMAVIVDALNPLRNKGSVAHPNELLDDAEAMLAINSVRTLLHYLNTKISPQRG